MAYKKKLDFDFIESDKGRIIIPHVCPECGKSTDMQLVLYTSGKMELRCPECCDVLSSLDDDPYIEGVYYVEEKCMKCGESTDKAIKYTSPSLSNWCMGCGCFLGNISKERNAKGNRNSSKQTRQRRAVKEEANYICAKCGRDFSNDRSHLDSHHVDHYKTKTTGRDDKNNQIALCKECHAKMHSAGTNGTSNLNWLRHLNEADRHEVSEFLAQIVTSLIYTGICYFESAGRCWRDGGNREKEPDCKRCIIKWCKDTKKEGENK